MAANKLEIVTMLF